MEKGTAMSYDEFGDRQAAQQNLGEHVFTAPPTANAMGFNGPTPESTRRVMVIGGSSGIGAAVAHLTLTGLGIQTWAYGIKDLDVRDYARLHQEIMTVRPTHLVYSAGYNQLDWAQNIFSTTFADVMAINVKGFLDTMQILMDLHDQTSLPYKPSVVAISSDAARRPMRTSAVYCASKAALDMVVRVMARERAGQGWRINAVAPGKVSDTNMTKYVDLRVQEIRGWTPEYADAYERASSALGRPATPEEVAQVVADVLFGPAALNGAIVEVNGGR